VKPARAQLKPGWRMTQDQADLFWRLWRAACAWQGWDKLPSAERDARRREMLAECGFSSLTLVDSTHGFDAVKKRLEELAGVVHNERADAGDRRRILAIAREAMSDLLASGYPPRAVDTILRERFHIVEGVRAIADLDTDELLNLSRTLTARLASWNKLPKTPLQPPSKAVARPIFQDLFGNSIVLSAG
jgi:hypothetical protein